MLLCRASPEDFSVAPCPETRFPYFFFLPKKANNMANILCWCNTILRTPQRGVLWNTRVNLPLPHLPCVCTFPKSVPYFDWARWASISTRRSSVRNLPVVHKLSTLDSDLQLKHEKTVRLSWKYDFGCSPQTKSDLRGCVCVCGGDPFYSMSCELDLVVIVYIKRWGCEPEMRLRARDSASCDVPGFADVPWTV